MVIVSIKDIENDVQGYLRLAQAGEVIIVADNGRTIVELKPVASKLNGLRPFGQCAGEFQVPDNFDAPLPDEVLRIFGTQ